MVRGVRTLQRVQGQRGTLIDVLLDHAGSTPTRTLYTYLLEGRASGPTASLTYAETARAALGIAVAIRDRAARGDRALLLYPPGLAFITGYLGCLAAGVIAVPAWPPDPSRLARTLPRLQAIASDAAPSVVLTTSEILAFAPSLFDLAPDLGKLEWVATDVIAGSEDATTALRVDPEDVAFLQYTSGSTGTPRGVRVTHGNLIANEQMIADFFQYEEDEHVVSWLPQYHDMGLIGSILNPLAIGARATLLSPLEFLKRPAVWLETISQLRATTSGGPNFAYELCVRKTTVDERAALDLRAWRCAFCGAEPIRADTLGAFADAFAPSGFRSSALLPCYGLAEATLIVTGKLGEPQASQVSRGALARGRAEHGADAASIVASGVTHPSGEVHIVDPSTRRIVGEDVVGEIVVVGPHVAAGYWGHDEHSAFGVLDRARGIVVAERGAEGSRCLSTGDLGFLRDGALHVTGRVKDLVIIAGRNLYPQDVERTAETSDPQIRPGCVAAFAIDDGATEGLAIVAEVDVRRGDGDLPAIVARLSSAVTADHDVRPTRIVLLAPGQVCKTSSGKIQRSATRAALDAAELTPLLDVQTHVEVPREPSRPTLDAGLVTHEARMLAWILDAIGARVGARVDESHGSRTFAELGLGSRDSVELLAKLEKHAGRPFAASVIFDHPTPVALSRFVCGDKAMTPEVMDGPVTTEREPIAVVGMACRFPGGCETPEQFWRLLAEGVDAVVPMSEERWGEAGALAAKVPRAVGALREVDRFDAAFFHMTAREAAATDPQHRLLLTVAWEALERAGITPASLDEAAAGVYVGMTHSDYARRHLYGDAVERLDVYAATGSAPSAAVGRIAHALGLRGPALAVDTACSSSLVAVHLAMQALRAGDLRLALVGGVNLVLDPELSLALARGGMLSINGACRTFDADADGYVRGEGCALLVLKRLRDALRDGDPIACVLRGSAINQDGRTNGLTAPSPEAQRALMRAALEDAGVSARDVHYVEAHGTGTPLGDPIELGSLEAVYGGDRPEPAVVGSVKTNVGHLEAAAGVAGLIKVALALEHRAIPPHLHLRSPTPRHPWADGRLRVATSLEPWPACRDLPRAAVSAFGFVGTNAHVVLEAPPPRANAARRDGEGPFVLPLSARTDGALCAAARRWADAVADEGTSLSGLCAVAQTRRTPFERRAIVVGQSRDDLVRAATAVAEGRADAGAYVARSACRAAPRVAFVFPGQGVQFPGMARDLYVADSTFRRVVDECSDAIGPYGGITLRELWTDDRAAARIDETAWTQPALFALGVGLTACLRARGIEPAVVLGHSVGEYSAACAASLTERTPAARLVAVRGRLMGSAPGEGAMLALRGTERDARRILAIAPSLEIAAINGERAITLTGPAAAVRAVVDDLPRLGLEGRLLDVAHAFHSALMEPILDRFEAAWADVATALPRIPLVSNLTGELAGEGIASPLYWRTQLRERVEFRASLASLTRLEVDVVLELGPQASLLSLSANVLPHAARCAVLARDLPGPVALNLAIGVAWTAGAAVRWQGPALPDAMLEGALSRAPTYAFEPTRAWLDRLERGVDTSSVLGARLPPIAGSPDVTIWDRRRPRARTLDLPAIAKAAAADLFGEGAHIARIVAADVDASAAGSGCQVTAIRRGIHAADIVVHAREGASFVELGCGEIGRADHVFHVDWEPLPLAVSASRVERWVIGADTTEQAASLAAQIEARGGRVAMATDRSAASVMRLVEEVAAEGIVIFSTARDGWGDLARNDGLVSLLRAVHRYPDERRPRLWIVTHGAQLVSGRGGEGWSAGVWGFGRAVAHEAPRAWGGLIDLDPARSIDEGLPWVAGALLAPPDEDQLALREGRIHVPRLRPDRSAIASGTTLRIRSDRSYVVTGGLGGIGLLLAEALVERGAGHVTLVGRRELAAAASDRLASMRRRGSVDAIAADVADAVAMDRVLSGTPSPVGAIFHLAGTFTPHDLDALRPEDFTAELRPKLGGVEVIGRIVVERDITLDALVLFGSAAAVWGSRRLAPYAVANAALDGAAASLRARGIPATTLAFGLLADGGMSAGPEARALADLGLFPLPFELVVDAALRLACAGKPSYVVALADWPRFRSVFEAWPRRAILSALAGSGASAHERTGQDAGAVIESVVRAVMGLAADAPLALTSDLRSLGLDSIQAVEIALAVSRETGLSLTAARVLSSPDLAAITRAIEAGDTNGEARPLRPAAALGPRPATTVQHGLYFEELSPSELPRYNLQVRLVARGRLDHGAVEQALRVVVARHASLRTIFQWTEGRLQGEVLSDPAIETRIVDVSHEPDPHTRARAEARRDGLRRFDLGNSAPLRLFVASEAEDAHVVAVTIHHVAADGVSLGVILREWASAYGALTAGRAPELATPRFDYTDVSAWWEEELASERGAKARERWKKELAGVPSLRLPTRAAPAFDGHGVLARFGLTPAIATAVRALAARERATSYNVLFAVYGALLHQLSGQDDFAIGTVFSTRDRSELTEVVGPLIHTVALRFRPDPKSSFLRLLANVRDSVVGALREVPIPLPIVAEDLRGVGHRDAPFSAFFNLDARPLEVPVVPGLSIAVERDAPDGAIEGTARFLLGLSLTPEPEGGYSAALEGDAAAFSAEEIASLADRFVDLLARLIGAPERPLGAFSARSSREEDLERAWNRTARPLPAPATLDRYLRRGHRSVEAEIDEAEPAICDGTRTFTRSELWQRADRYASALTEAGLRRGDRVGVGLERGAEALAAVLGALRIGVAYVPIDRELPDALVGYIIDDAQVSRVVGDPELFDEHPNLRALALAPPGLTSEPLADVTNPPEPEDVAYVLFTSGSAGRPKGVEVPHRAVVNVLEAFAEITRTGTGDRWLWLTSMSFDISVLEMLLPLTTGGTTTTVSRETARDAAALARTIAVTRPTWVQATPTTWSLLRSIGAHVDGGMGVLSGGEPLSPALAAWLARSAREVWNVYGPTETTVWSTAWRVPRDFDPATDEVRIGRPLQNTQTFVVDTNAEVLTSLPVGASGELCIGGAGVARGYTDPALTRARFVRAPGLEVDGAIYRTGDRVRRRLDGDLVHLGRLDRQVKIRGHRMELDAIEAVLAKAPAVEGCAVVVRDLHGSPSLVAYVTPERAAVSDVLYKHLAALLPAPMLPALFVGLADLPQTANGKLDRSRLPEPAGPIAAPLLAEEPTNELEAELLALWRSVLGGRAVGVHDEFFAVGGHSLLVIELANRIEARLRRRLPMAVFFANRTIATQAQAIERRAALASNVVTFRDEPTATPLAFLPPVSGIVTGYAHLARSLEGFQQIFGVQAPGVDFGEPLTTIPALAERYDRDLAPFVGDRPLVLVGWSMGGLVALELAARRLRSGRPVHGVCLIDTWPPEWLRRLELEPCLTLEARRHELARHAGMISEAVPASHVDRLWRVYEANWNAARSWKAERLGAPVPVLFVRAEEPLDEAMAGAVRAAPDLGWAERLGSPVRVMSSPGNHLTMLDLEHTRALATAVGTTLDTGTASTGSLSAFHVAESTQR